MEVEARWAVYAAWLCEDTGDRRARDGLLDSALNLAGEADHPDVIVWARARQAQWSDGTRAIQKARCWAALRPVRGVALYDRVLRGWPREEARDEGLYRARLALACAGAGEPDRARSEGRKALAIARTTKSSVAARELRRLGAALSTT